MILMLNWPLIVSYTNCFNLHNLYIQADDDVDGTGDVCVGDSDSDSVINYQVFTLIQHVASKNLFLTLIPLKCCHRFC